MHNLVGISVRDYKQVLADLERIWGQNAERFLNDLADYMMTVIGSATVIDFGRFRIEQEGGKIYLVIVDFQEPVDGGLWVV